MAKPTHELMLDLLDYADTLVPQIQAGEVHYVDSFFMTLVYLEDMLDKYGRGLGMSSAKDAGLDGRQMLATLTGRMDELRKTIRSLVQEGDFDHVLKTRSEQLIFQWRKR